MFGSFLYCDLFHHDIYPFLSFSLLTQQNVKCPSSMSINCPPTLLLAHYNLWITELIAGTFSFCLQANTRIWEKNARIVGIFLHYKASSTTANILHFKLVLDLRLPEFRCELHNAKGPAQLPQLPLSNILLKKKWRGFLFQSPNAWKSWKISQKVCNFENIFSMDVENIFFQGCWKYFFPWMLKKNFHGCWMLTLKVPNF